MFGQNNRFAGLKKGCAAIAMAGMLVVGGLPAPALAETVESGDITVEDVLVEEAPKPELELVDAPDDQQLAGDVQVVGQVTGLDAQSVIDPLSSIAWVVNSEEYTAIKKVLELGNITITDEEVIKQARQAYDSLSPDQRKQIEQLIPKIPEYIARAEKQLAELKKPAQAITAADKTVSMGKTVKLGAKTSGNGKLTYGCSNTAVATVSAKGVVTPKSVGTAKIIITAASTNSYRKAAKTVNVTVTQGKQAITAADKTVLVGKTVKLGAKTTGDGKLTYKSSDTAVATVSAAGVVTGNKAGNAIITIKAAATGNYKKATKQVAVSVSKAANTLVAKATNATVTASFSTLKKKGVTLASNVTVSKAKGALTYANASTDATAQTFSVNASTGEVTVPKGTKKGTYQVRVKVTAKGTASYQKASKKVSYKVQVK